jgi:hypothetical protein
MEFPSVEHKLPELFKSIITIGRCKDLIFASPLVKLEHYKEVKKRESELRTSAENYIKKQKGN